MHRLGYVAGDARRRSRRLVTWVCKGAEVGAVRVCKIAGKSLKMCFSEGKSNFFFCG